MTLRVNSDSIGLFSVGMMGAEARGSDLLRVPFHPINGRKNESDKISVMTLIAGVLLSLIPWVATAKDLPKVVVWDLAPRETKPGYAQELTSILVSEISKLGKYEVYSQENVRTLAGWTAEKMKLGCTSTECLMALGQMDVAKLISGSVGRIGNRYSVSLSLFNTQNARAEKALSEFAARKMN